MKKTIIFLTAALTAAVTLAVGFAVRMTRAEKALSLGTAQSLSALSESLDTTRTALAKLAAEGENEELRREIAESAGTAAEALSRLPLGEEALARTMSFFNCVGDWSRYGGGTEDAAALAEACDELYAELGAFLLTDPHALALALTGGETRGSEGGTDVFTMPGENYPRLIYDGPFSADAASPVLKAAEGLAPTTEESVREAWTRLTEEGEVTVTRAEAEIPFWLAEGKDGTAVCFADAGTLVWWAYAETDGGDGDYFTDEEACAMALETAERFGYTGLEPVFVQHGERGITVNLAYTENGVICYADLVKVTVTPAGDFALLEAGNYLKGHTQRSIPAARLGDAEARAFLPESADGTATGGRLVLVPPEDYGGSETLCREYAYVFRDRECRVYIDAENGGICDLLLIEDETVR